MLLRWACHLILGRPWQYDVDATPRCKDNVYEFFMNGRKIDLGLSRRVVYPKLLKKWRGNRLKDQFDKEAKESKQVFAVAVTDGGPKAAPEIPPTMQPLLKEFEELFLEELSAGLPSMRDVQHHIDLVPRASIPNLPLYCMNLKESQILHGQVDKLLSKGQIREGMSPCTVSALLTHKKDGS